MDIVMASQTERWFGRRIAKAFTDLIGRANVIHRGEIHADSILAGKPALVLVNMERKDTNPFDLVRALKGVVGGRWVIGCLRSHDGDITERTIEAGADYCIAGTRETQDIAEVLRALIGNDVFPIAEAVCARFGIPVWHLLSSRKSRVIALARQITMYLAYKHTEISQPQVGMSLGGKDHTTVLLASRCITKMTEADTEASHVTVTSPQQETLHMSVLLDQIMEKVESVWEGAAA